MQCKLKAVARINIDRSRATHKFGEGESFEIIAKKSTEPILVRDEIMLQRVILVRMKRSVRWFCRPSWRVFLIRVMSGIFLLGEPARQTKQRERYCWSMV